MQHGGRRDFFSLQTPNAKAFRQIVSDTFGLSSDPGKYDSRAGGHAKWLAEVHSIELPLPDPLPFAGVEFEPRQSMKYRSEIDVEALIGAAGKELRDKRPEARKVFSWTSRWVSGATGD
jgi:hypothetical protein